MSSLDCFVLEQGLDMDIFDNILGIAFGPGDGMIFLIASVFVGLATGRLSSLWLAVLFAVGFDVAIPGAVEMLDGASFDSAHTEALQRISHEGGSGLLLRAIGYFGTITGIVLLKKGLGNG
jgi:hypothetical protein